MRYIAILKDSLREAWDSWVLLGLLVVSTLVILFVASLSFKPQSAQKTMALFFPDNPFQPSMIVRTLNNRKPEKVILGRPAGGWANFKLQEVKLVPGSGEADSPLAKYELTVSSGGMMFGDPMMAPHVEVNGQGQPAEKKKPVVDVKVEAEQLRKLFEDAEELGYIKVVDIEPIPKAEDAAGPQQYRTTVEGTAMTHRLWATEPCLAFGALPLEFFAAPLSTLLYTLASYVIKIGSWIAVLLGIVITSFFIPNMLRKGTVDLLLVKPISRWLLLLYKYLGGLTFILLSTAYAIGGVWLALGLRSGLWANGTLILILSITFFFAILYAVSTFVGVVTRSVVTSILVTVAAWVVFAVIGLAYSGVDLLERIEKQDDIIKERMKQPLRPAAERWTGGWTFTIIKVVHAISPRTEDLNELNDLIVYTDFLTGNIGDMGKFDNSKRNWWEALFVSGAWIGIFLGLAALWFTFKDY
jgi:ABC-type transport system involved in multi-copper enzyme maturation permease subunit